LDDSSVQFYPPPSPATIAYQTDAESCIAAQCSVVLSASFLEEDYTCLLFTAISAPIKYIFYSDRNCVSCKQW